MKPFIRFAILGCVFAVGCSAPIPTSPSPPPPPLPPPPPSAPPAVPSSASLAIEDLYVIMHSRPVIWLEPRFLLRETGGRSGATLQTVLIGDGSDEGEMAWVNCWRDALRVPPGGTLDTFYTKAGWDWLSYCAPSYDASVNTTTLKAPVTLKMTFLDDEGRTGLLDFRGEARVILEP